MRTFLSIVGGIVLILLVLGGFFFGGAYLASRVWHDGDGKNNAINEPGLAPVVNKLSAQADRIEAQEHKTYQRLNKVDYKVSRNGEGIADIKASVAKIRECLAPLCGDKALRPRPRMTTRTVAPAPPAPVISRPPAVVTGDYIKIEAYGKPAIIVARRLGGDNPCCPPEQARRSYFPEPPENPTADVPPVGWQPPPQIVRPPVQSRRGCKAPCVGSRR